MTSDDDGTLQAIESFYKIHRTNWTEAYSNTCETKPSFQLRIKYAIELAKNSSARLVLDAGCGTGQLIAELARSGIPCDGIDASTEMLAIAKARLQSPLPYQPLLVRGNLESIQDYPSSEYNLITAFGVFVHEIDEHRVLRNFHRKLSPDGLVFISFRNLLFSIFTLNEHTMVFYN